MSKQAKVQDLLAEFMGELTKSAEETGKEKSVSEGARASENSSDVKNSVPGTSVDSAAPVKGANPGAGPNNPILNRGTNVGETGTDVPDTKSEYSDPGTSHPAKTASLNNLVEQANDALAAITVLVKAAAVKVPAAPGNPVATSTATATATKPVAKPVGAVKPTEEKVASAEETVSVSKARLDELTKAAEFVEELAGYISGQQVAEEVIQSNNSGNDFQKLAEDEVSNFLKLAEVHSDNLIHTLLGAVKQANDLAAAGAIDPSALAGAGTVETSPSPEAGMMGGGEIDPETLAQIVQALQESGVSIEDLEAAAQSLDGGGETAPAPEAGNEGNEGDKVDAARAASVGADEGSNEEKTAAAKQALQAKAAEFAVKFVKAASAKSAEKGKTNK